MKISASGEYAVRILVEIAKCEKYVSLKDVANKLDISLKFAEKIVAKFVKSNILVSLRGQDGGYKLAKKPDEVKIKQILEITGDVTNVTTCLSADCPHKDDCTSISVWEKLNALINDYLNNVSISDLIDKKNAN
ncbi:MAG TPA: Rrf2 family transcriptional regulator [Clostridiales bacterium]|nr:Rrf2 family transcriptional regulator [Clostridiales bacterium]